jgi:hypothetical protein
MFEKTGNTNVQATDTSQHDTQYNNTVKNAHGIALLKKRGAMRNPAGSEFSPMGCIID